MTNMPHEPAEPHDPDERAEAGEARTDAAIRDLNARVLWPQRPDRASLGTPKQSPMARTAPAGNTHRTATPIRKLGVGILGLIGGLLVGLLVRFIVPNDLPLVLALLLGAVTLTFAVVGVVIALVIDQRYLTRRARRPPAEQP